MINKLIVPSKSEDMLFLSGLIMNIMNAEEYGKSYPVLPELLMTMGIENTINLIKYFGGQEIKIPDHEEMYKTFLVIVCFYKKKIEEKSWDEIKQEVNIDISSHSLGKILKSIEDKIKLDFDDLKNLGIEEFIKGMENGK